MSERLVDGRLRRLRAEHGRALRVGHLTTVDTSLSVLLRTELEYAVLSGIETYGLSAPGPSVPLMRAMGVAHVALPSLSRRWDVRSDVRAARELYGALRDLELDVLHTHNPKTGVIGRVVGRLAGVPVVVNTCHGLWATRDDRPLKRLGVYAAEVLAAAFSHAELYQNDADRTTLAHWVGQRKVQVVGNGTDLEQFVPDARARRRVRHELGLGENEVLVGGVGRLVAEKGYAEFTAAAEALSGRAVFVWAGRPDPDKHDAVSADSPFVRLLGQRSDMAAVHNAFDVFVLPSYREGFSRSAMESAACGTAMVLTDIRGCREIGRDGREVLLVPPRDPGALTRAVATLIDDTELRCQLASHARRRALACFDQRTVAAVSQATYARVAQDRGLGWRWEVAS